MNTHRLRHASHFRIAEQQDLDRTLVVRGRSCANCGALMSDDFRFCAGCGQKALMGRLALHDIVHDLVHAVIHADKSLFALLKDLLVRPGVVAREYALEGKRKRYFNPFAFLVLALGASVSVNAIVHPYAARAHQLSAEATPAMHALFARQDRTFLLIERYPNVVTFISLPILAFVFWLFARRRRVRYAEVLVAQVFFIGLVTAVGALLITPFAHRFPNPLAYNMTLVAFQLVYLTIANRQLCRERGVLSWFRSALASASAFAVWTVLSLGAGYAYILYG